MIAALVTHAIRTTPLADSAAKRSNPLKSLLILLSLCCACSSQNLSNSSEKLCSSDIDCTAGWTPASEKCGTTDRCLNGVCTVPPGISGDVKAREAELILENGTVIYLEVMSSLFQTARGMMCRLKMASGFGMWFIEQTQKPQHFWMKNTNIPLDMVFINEDFMVVGVIENAEPMSLESRGVLEPSRYVLELNAGDAAKYNLKFGSRVKFKPRQKQ